MSNYLIWMLIKPSQWVYYAAILGVLAWRTRVGRHSQFVAAALITVLGVLPTAALLMRPLERRFETPANLERVDGIVVLAGSELPVLTELYQEPQLSSMGDRITTFLRLAQRFEQARLVHSGGAMTRGLSQSDAARALILAAGINPSRVTFEARSGNTCESARLTQSIVRPAAGERWLLVTSGFHMPRAMACFRAVGWEVIPYPTDFRRGALPFSLGLAGNLEDVDLAAHEWLGLVYYRVRGFTEEWFPGPTGGL